LCLHEESAVAIAQGYAKTSGTMMGAVVHSNVGLMHASMAIFNAWCDRMPVLVLGATGPWDAAKRRPWIDWIHTASDQGALVRDYTKWDNQPASVPAAYEAILRAAQIANTAPRGPTYVNLDAALQEAKIGALPPLPDVKRHRAPDPVLPAAHLVEAAAKLLSGAKHPVILAGRALRSESGWKQRVALAEKLQARVLTDIKLGAAFPTDHPLHAAPPATFLSPDTAKLLREADVVLALDWIDPAGVLKQAWGAEPVGAKVIQVSPDAHLHRGWSMDYQGLPPVDLYMMCEPEAAVAVLLDAVKARPAALASKPAPLPDPAPDAVSIRTLADALNAATKGMDVCITRLPLGWNGAYRHFRHPLDYIGSEGGGGVGAGPGITVGAALALKGSGRLAVAIMGDGDFLMGATALWTATHYGIPCLILIANNRSFFNDELHQERVAKERSRPVENRWIGQRISGPDIDLAMMARAQGAEGIGPIAKAAELRPAIEKGIQAVRGGTVCVVDVRVAPGYDTNLSASSASQKR
jgi:thiamine pyrophosphate-dependent acetolactate synthase large subunit-like protein